MSRKIRKNWLAIIGLVSLATTAVAGSCTSLYFGYKNYEKGPDFDKSYNLRMEINTEETENPWSKNTGNTYEDIVRKSKATAESFSKYLSKANKADYPVYSEVVESAPNTYRAFLNVVVPNEKVASTLDPDIKVDKTTGEIYFEYYSAPKISAIYSDAPGAAQPNYYDFTQEFLTNITVKDNVEIGGDSKQQINIKLNDELDFKKIKEAFKPEAKEPDTNAATYEPFMYIFNDEAGLLNRMKYIISLARTSDEYAALDDSEKQFWNDYTTGGTVDEFKPLKILKSSNAFTDTKDTETRELKYSSILVPEPNENGRSFIENITWEDGQMHHTGEVKYDFVKKYLLGIVKRSEAGSEDYTSFHEFFPEKNPTDSKKDSDYKWMVVKQPDKFSTEVFHSAITSEKLIFPFLPCTLEQIQVGIIGKDSAEPSNIFVINPTFDNGILGFNSMTGVMVAALVIVLILGIIVSVLYRIPGLISFLLIVLTMSLSFLTLSMVGYLISGTLVCGLFVGFLLGLLVTINCFERIKKEISNGYTILVSIKRALAKTFLPIVDISIVALLCGVGLVYIGSSQFLSLGVLMILVSLLTFPIVFGGQSLIMYMLYRNDSIGNEKINLFISAPEVIQSKSLTTFETTFKQSKLKIPFNLFNKKLLITLSSLVLAFLVISMAVVFTVGDLNSLAYSGGTRVMIDINYIKNFFDGEINNFINAIGGGWKSSGINGSYWVISSSSGVSFSELAAKLIGKVAPSINEMLVQTAIPNNFTVLTNTTIGMIFAISGLLSAYSLVRFNWVSVIPIFFASFLAPALTILLFMSCQIYVDQTIIPAVTIGYIINNLLVFNLMANIANKSVKKEKGDLNSLKSVLNVQVWGSTFFFGMVSLFLVASLIAMGLLISDSIVSLILIVLVTSVLSILVCCLFIPQTYILFKSISNKYIRRVNKIESRQEVFDKVDEQLIPGINSEK